VSGSLDQLPRLLALVPYLLARPGISFAAAAADFGITEERLRKDLDLVWMCGLPGHSPGDLIDVEFEGDTITLFEPQGVTRPLRLSADEALALVVALRALIQTPGLVETDAVLRALAKVEQAAGTAARPAGRVEVALERPDQVLGTVRDALERARRLHLRYHVPARDQTTERDVDPVRLLVVDGRSYLEGWCRSAQDVRLFRLDRVVEATVLDLPAEPAELPDRDLEHGLFQPSPEDLRVRMVLQPGAHWVADYHPCESVEELGDGALGVVLRTPDYGWVRRLALRLGGAGRVVDPPELAAQIRTDAAAALAAYAPGS